MILPLFLASLFLAVHSGHIYPQDIIISPNNKNSPSDITLIFTLETSLAPTDYLRMIFPFRLNSIQPATWDTYINCTITGTGKRATVTPSAIAGDSTSYFAQFYTDLIGTTLSNLTSNVTYYLKFTGTPDPSAQTGLNLPIQLFTVSNNQGNWIVYDSNTVFGTLTLADAYPSTMTVTLSIPSTELDSTVLGADYKVNVDIVPKVTLKDRARVDIQLTNSAFALLSCKSVSSTYEGITSLPTTFTSLAQHIIRATVTKTLTAGNGVKYRFECLVRNPAFAATTKVIVKNRMGYIETISESGSDTVGLQASSTESSTTSSGWDETAHKVLLGWGYDASSTNALSIFGLYKDANPTERWYQSVKTTFKPKTDVAATTDKLQVVISTINDSGFKILTVSIYHNLPDYSGSAKVSCNILIQGYLTCQNVGTLLSTTTYFVSFRFNLLSTTTVSTVADFGKVSVQTQVASPVMLVPISATTLKNKNIRANVALFTSSSTNGIIAYSTTKTTPTTTKYVTNGEDVILKFAFKYFTNTFIPLQTTNIDRGIEFYTSQALASSTSPTCTIQGLAQTTDVIISACGVDQSTSYTRLRFRIEKFTRVTSGTPPFAQFTSSPLDGQVNFDKVQFGATQFSSLNYVSDNVFDYYARWVQDFTSPTATANIATGSSPFFFNSVVHKNGALANVKVGTSFFVTGATASDPSNDGTSFPTLIRITGYLTVAEQSLVNRMLLFFNDLEPLNTATPCFGAGVTCKYNANGLDNTQTNSLTDYSGSRRIEINLDFTQKFNIYIPVKTISQKTSMGFFVTTAAVIDAAATNLGIFSTLNSKRIDQVTSTSTTLTITPVGGSTPKISVTGTPLMGSTIDTTITNIAASYVPTAANTATLIGAAYGYCANYDFTKATGFYFQPFYNPSFTADQICVTVKYSPTTSKDVTCHVCPVHTAISGSSVTVGKFTLPTLAGRDFYDLVYIVSENTGDFKKAVVDNQATVLNAFSLTSLGITFNPTTFKKTSKNVIARISFTVVSDLPKSIRINITPTGASTSLLVTPVSTVPCMVNSTNATSCTTSGTHTNIQIDAVALGSIWPAGTHMIDFMVDATSSATSISADTTINFKATIKVDGLTALNALHHDSTAQTFIIKNAASNYIGLYNISYLFGNKYARTIVSFVFELPNDMKVYPAQQIAFDLGGIATANPGETPFCLVKEPPLLSVSNSFASCDVSDLTQLTLQTKASVTGNYTLELHFLHVPSSAAPAGISAKVLAADGSTVVAQNLPSTPLALPKTPASNFMPILNVNLDRLYSDPGNVAELVLNLRPSMKPIDISTRLYMYFPSYYPDKLGYQNIWCTANDLPVSCSIMGSRLIQLNSFPVDIPVGENIKVKIYGVVTPVVPATRGKIFIALSASESLYELTEQIEITDKASNSALPTTLTVDGFSVSSQKIRETADYTLVFTTDAIGIRTNKKISIDFPDRYGSILRGQEAPKISIYKTGDSLNARVIQSDSFGSRFKITPPYNLEPKTSYTFIIQQIDNPEQPTCNMDKPMITITDSSENSAFSRTAPNIWNVANIDYVTDESLKTLSWADKTGNQVTMLSLTIGILSPEIRIVPPTGETFASDISFTKTTTEVSVNPDTLKAVRGTPYLTIRVGAPMTTFPRIILLDLKKDESSTKNAYAELPKLQLTLTNNKNTLPTPIIRIMKGGTSFPYLWELDTLDLIPHTELKIDVTINQPTLSPLSVVGASSISFNPSSPRSSFTFTLASSADALNPPSFVLTLGGQDSANYQLKNATVTVGVLNPITTGPTLLQATPTLNYSPTKQQFSLMTDQMAAVYWHIAFENRLSTSDCLRVRSRYNEGNLYDSTSPTQAQYGVFYIYQENNVTTGEISNLLSKETYSYILCPSNQLDYMGTAATGTFQTKDNLASLSIVTLTFSQSLTTSQLTSMVCVFTKDLQLPDLNVVAMEGTSCAASSIFDEYKDQNITTLSVFINGDRTSNFDQTVTNSLTLYVASISAKTPSSFLTTFNQALRGAGLTNMFQTISLQTGITYPLPVIDEAATIKTTILDTEVTVNGLALSSGPGIFYAIATDDATTVPTQVQIKAKLSGRGSGTSGANAVYDSTPISITLSSLKADTDYLIYYYASSADRTQYSRVTDVKYLRIRTKPKVETAGASKMEINLVIIFIISIASWLF